MPPSIANKSPYAKLVASKSGFYRADIWASHGHVCPNSGRAGPPNQQLNNQVNERATILFGR